jgi:hypothetical protein
MLGRLISAFAVCRPGGPSLQHEQQDRSPWPSVSRTCALRVELDALRAAEAVLRDALATLDARRGRGDIGTSRVAAQHPAD